MTNNQKKSKMKKIDHVEQQPRLNLVFNFWKNNRKDQHFALKEHEVIQKFIEWKKQQLADPARGEAWWDYYYGSSLVNVFISEGLHCVNEPKEYNDLYDSLKPSFKLN